MNREEAFELVKRNLKNSNLIKHSLSVEICMREFAKKFGEDEEKWGLAGLLHDLDYDHTVNDPDNHSLKTVDMLKEYHLNPEILNAIKAHNQKADMISKMDIALYTIDPTTGFITACALMHPDKKLESINLKRMKKRFKAKAFARGANRDQMRESSKLGIELDASLEICLKAMKSISDQLEL
jgi:putative nucleotidyltransferase with HDIG domain